MAKPKKIEISHRTIVFTAVFILSLWFLFFIRDILLQIFVALLIMTILNPFVKRLAKYKIPRPLSIIFAYLLVFLLVGVTIGGLLPALVDQSSHFVNDVPEYLDALGTSSIYGERILSEIVSEIGKLPSLFAKTGVNILSNVVEVFTVLIFAFYLLLERDRLDEQIGVFFGKKRKAEIDKIFDILEKKLGGWVRGQITLMVLVGTVTYVGLLVLGVPFALPLGILAGLLEIVPYVGPWLAAIPAVVIALGISPFMGIAAASLSFLIQQLENYVLVPKVMEKSVGVPPVVTLITLAIGFKVAGIAGVLISVPVVITLQVVISEYFLEKNNNNH